MTYGLLAGNDDLEQAAEVVIHHLRRRYENLPERTIKREVGRAFAGLSDVKVTIFVLVLAEREAAKRLEARTTRG